MCAGKKDHAKIGQDSVVKTRVRKKKNGRRELRREYGRQKGTRERSRNEEDDGPLTKNEREPENKEDELREEEERREGRANEYGSGAMGRIFLRDYEGISM